MDSSTRAWDPHTTVRSARCCIPSRLVALRHLPAQAWPHFSCHGAQRTASNCQTFKFKETPQRVGTYHDDIDDIDDIQVLCHVDVNQNMARGNVETIRMVPSCHLASQSAALTLCPSLGCGHILKPRSHAARKHAGQSYPVTDFAKIGRWDKMRRDWMSQAAWQTNYNTCMAFFRLDAFTGSQKQLMKNIRKQG